MSKNQLLHFYDLLFSHVTGDDSHYTIELWLTGMIRLIKIKSLAFLDFTYKWYNTVFVFFCPTYHNIMCSRSIHIVTKGGMFSFLIKDTCSKWLTNTTALWEITLIFLSGLAVKETWDDKYFEPCQNHKHTARKNVNWTGKLLWLIQSLERSSNGLSKKRLSKKSNSFSSGVDDKTKYLWLGKKVANNKIA